MNQMDKVSLPAVISDRYGVSQALAEEEILQGNLLIDGVPVDPQGRKSQGLWFDRDWLEGKEISVEGKHASYTFTYEQLPDFPRA